MHSIVVSLHPCDACMLVCVSPCAGLQAEEGVMRESTAQLCHSICV